MYYSTVLVTPELLYRHDLFPFQQEHILLSVAAASLIGHIFLGFFYKFKINFPLENWPIGKWKTIQRWYNTNPNERENKVFLQSIL